MKLSCLYLSLFSIFYSSGAFSNGHPDLSLRNAPWASGRRRTSTAKSTTSPADICSLPRTATLLEEPPTDAMDIPKNVVDEINAIDSKRKITVSTSLDLPFAPEIAFDKFSDLPRQAEFSPWLRKVEYLTPPEPGVPRVGKDLGETKWTMGFRGIRFSWNAISTKLERPNIIEYQSTSGMKNFGSVEFEPHGEEGTKVTMTMTVVVPRLVAGLFKRSSVMAKFVQNRLLRTTLVNFREIVWTKDLGNTEPGTPLLTKSEDADNGK